MLLISYRLGPCHSVSPSIRYKKHCNFVSPMFRIIRATSETEHLAHMYLPKLAQLFHDRAPLNWSKLKPIAMGKAQFPGCKALLGVFLYRVLNRPALASRVMWDSKKPDLLKYPKLLTRQPSSVSVSLMFVSKHAFKYLKFEIIFASFHHSYLTTFVNIWIIAI